VIFQLLLTLSLQLPTPAAPEMAPSRVVNVPRLIAESIVGKAATAQLRAFRVEQQKGIADKQSALQKLNQSRAASTQIERARLELERATQDAEVDLAALNKQMQEELNRRLRPVLNKIAEEDHIGIIFEYPQELIVWIAPSIDITAKVIERLDAASKDQK
jgi:Skp family chaperone for outer membrane proteins